LFSSLHTKIQVSHPYKTAGRILVILCNCLLFLIIDGKIDYCFFNSLNKFIENLLTVQVYNFKNITLIFK
jgi:hypothetical protein